MQIINEKFRIDTKYCVGIVRRMNFCGCISIVSENDISLSHKQVVLYDRISRSNKINKT